MEIGRYILGNPFFTQQRHLLFAHNLTTISSILLKFCKGSTYALPKQETIMICKNLMTLPDSNYFTLVLIQF